MNNELDIATLHFNKLDGLIPVCVQDYETMQVLILGFMNEIALNQTLETKRITFYSRTQQKLWEKCDSKGNYMTMVDMTVDCDADALLIFAKREGTTCHTGNVSCFKNSSTNLPGFWITQLNQIIEEHLKKGDSGYTNRLLRSGLQNVTEKIKDEGSDLAILGMSGSDTDICNEVVDLFYFIFILLKARNIKLSEIAAIIQERREV